jgi:diguanylate cyclase (GGDEF)-like protein
MSLTSEHLERFVQRLDLLDTELARTSNHPTLLARAPLPRVTLPITDALTDLPNRKAIVGLAEREFRLTLASSTPLTLILFDVDKMKQINDRYLHTGGDAVLRQLCALLASSLLPGEFVGRFGGDSFLIVASGTNADQAVELVERASNVVRQGTFTHRDQEIRATITCGITVAGDGLGNPLPIDDYYLEGGVSDDLLPMIRTALGNMEIAKGRVPTRQATKAELIQPIRDEWHG